MALNAASTPVSRIGVFGGAFDPPHQGHLALAQAALVQLQLDALHVVPTGQAWHKTRPLTPANHRLAMTRLAFAGMERVVVDSREIARTGASYTVETLRELRLLYPHAELFLLLGQDQANALTTWYCWEEVLALAIICVASRAGLEGGVLDADALPEPKSRFRYLNMPPVLASSTAIRSHVEHFHAAPTLVLNAVARYIEDHHLYQTAR